MNFNFEETVEWTSGYARQRLATDLQKLAKGDPRENGIWMEMGRALYPPEPES